MTDPSPGPEASAAVRERIVELFGAVCVSPDDVSLAEAADHALSDLDVLLTTDRSAADAGAPDRLYS